MVNKNNNSKNTFNQLSILIFQDGFLFYLQHEDKTKSIDIKPTIVDDILSSKSLNIFKKEFQNLLNVYEFQNLKLAFSNTFYTFVPKEFYRENAKADYLKYNVKLFKEDQIVSEFIEPIDAYQVYIPLMSYHNLVLDQVKEFDYEHFTNTLIKHSMLSTHDTLTYLNVYIQNNLLDVIAYEGKKFKLCNSFNFETDLDLVYYILFCVEELKFDQKKLQLKLYYNTEENTWLETIKRYILNVKSEQKNLAAFIV